MTSYPHTKDDLLVAAIEHGCQPALRAWEEAGLSPTGHLPEDADPPALAQLGFDLAKQELRDYADLFRLTFDMFGVGTHNPRIAAAFQQFIDERRAFIARITVAIIAGMPARPAASADAIAAAIWGSLHGIYLQKVIDSGFDAEAAIDALREMVFAFVTRHPIRPDEAN